MQKDVHDQINHKWASPSHSNQPNHTTQIHAPSLIPHAFSLQSHNVSIPCPLTPNLRLIYKPTAKHISHLHLGQTRQNLNSKFQLQRRCYKRENPTVPLSNQPAIPPKTETPPVPLPLPLPASSTCQNRNIIGLPHLPLERHNSGPLCRLAYFSRRDGHERSVTAERSEMVTTEKEKEKERATLVPRGGGHADQNRFPWRIVGRACYLRLSGWLYWWTSRAVVVVVAAPIDVVSAWH